jgi:hypothetical protein
MKNNGFTKYTSEEILQIIIDFYNFQSEYCLEIGKEQNLNFQTTIKEWRNICELLEPNKLAKFYHELFDLRTDPSDLIDLLNKEEENTLQTFCDYIAQNAIKEKVNSIVSLGMKCQEAAIFKTLKDKLEKRGIDTKDFRPSTEFAPFFDKHASVLIEIISRLAPGSLTHYDTKKSIISKLGAFLLLISIIILITALITHKATWYIYIPFAISAVLLYVGNKLKPVQSEVGGYHTIRDLIVGMKIKMGSVN